MKIEQIPEALLEFTSFDRYILGQFVDDPTERNQCFFVGYISALNNRSYIKNETYSFFMGASKAIVSDAGVRETWKMTLELYAAV